MDMPTTYDILSIVIYMLCPFIAALFTTNKMLLHLWTKYIKNYVFYIQKMLG